MRVLASLCMAALAMASTMDAQGTATLSGRVLDSSQAAVGGAAILLENRVTGFRAAATSDREGAFTVRNIPFHAYTLSVDAPGFKRREQVVSLRSNVPQTIQITLELGERTESITVNASRELLVDPEETGTRAQMSRADMEKIARPGLSRGLESLIVTFPGFAQNANGAIHPRGAHNQMTFVIDGMPVSDQLTGAFANAVDPNIVETLELFTGNIPAEYGSKVSAVVNVSTRSGLGTRRRLSGSATAAAARFDLLSEVAQVAGETGRWGYSGTLSALKSHRYLDAVSLDNLHNGGNSERAFTRVDYQAGSRDTLRVNGIAGRSSFQLANLRSQQAAGMDQRQLLRDVAGSLGWVHVVSPSTTLESTTSYRVAESRLLPSVGDAPVTAAQHRRLATLTAGARLSRLQGAHNARAGFDVQRFPVREDFSFGITSPGFNAPADPAYNPNLAAHDLTRGGSVFRFAARDSGGMYSGFAQDGIKARRLQVTLGLRYDVYRFLRAGAQLQPRLGASFHVRETGTVLRASYNRLFQTPPNENLLLSNSRSAAALAPPAVAQALGSATEPIRPERQNFWEAGVQQAVGRRAGINLSFYHKDATNQQDNNNFLNTGIIFPIALKAIRVNGAEMRLNLPPVRGVSGWLSVTHSRAVSTPPFTGGLYIGNDAVTALSAGPFVIDHDQPLAVHGVLAYGAPSGFYANFSARYDYGLVANPSDPVQVAGDPDYADLLNLVDLRGLPARVR